MTCKDWYLVMNDTLYSCGNVRVKRVRLLALIQRATNRHNMFSQQRPVIPKVMPKWFFMAQSQNKTAAALWRKTHTACAEQVGMCVPAQINIWLTLQSGYYLAEISEREVGGLAGFWFPLFLPFFLSIAAGTHAGITGCNEKPFPIREKDCDSFPDSWPKCVKGSMR